MEVNGVTFNKPFVEKPVSAEDHNIYIYYPTSAGGGSQRLFRKVRKRNSIGFFYSSGDFGILGGKSWATDDHLEIIPMTGVSELLFKKRKKKLQSKKCRINTGID